MMDKIKKVRELQERLHRKEITLSQFEEALDDVLECDPARPDSRRRGKSPGKMSTLKEF